MPKGDRALSQPPTKGKSKGKGDARRTASEPPKGKGKQGGKASYYYDMRHHQKSQKFDNPRCKEHHKNLPDEIRTSRIFSPSPEWKNWRSTPVRPEKEADEFEEKQKAAEERVKAKKERLKDVEIDPKRLNKQPRSREHIKYCPVWPSAMYQVEKLEVVTEDEFFDRWTNYLTRKSEYLKQERQLYMIVQTDKFGRPLKENKPDCEEDVRADPGDDPNVEADPIVENQPETKEEEPDTKDITMGTGEEEKGQSVEQVQENADPEADADCEDAESGQTSEKGSTEASSPGQSTDFAGPKDDGYREDENEAESRIDLKQEPEPTKDVETEQEAQMLEDEDASAASENGIKGRYVLVDTGATGNLVHSTWLENNPIALQNVKSIDPERRRSYRFANGRTAICSSEISLATSLGDLTFDVLEPDHEAASSPPLLGMRTLKELGAQICLQTSRLLLKNRKPLQLITLSNGHLAIMDTTLFDSQAL